MLEFDSRGHIIPHKKIELTIEEFKTEFVDAFPKESSRHHIFELYLKFLTEFKKEVTNTFVQWVNGSFTTKKMNPSDIDFVTIIDKDIYIPNTELIESKFRMVAAKKKFGGEIDAYTIKKIEENEREFRIFTIEKARWTKQFSETKPNRSGKKFDKGFVEITFEEKEFGKSIK